MKTLLLACGSLVLACGFASAETFTGRLIDSACDMQSKQQTPDQQKTASANACTPTSATTAFAIADSNGKIVKLDADGNKKAADAFKKYNSSADRMRDPNNPAAATVTATVEGTLNGDEIKVDSIDLH